MLEINKAYSLRTNIIIKGINKKYWALDTNSGSQFRLNELSFDVLSAMDGKTTIEEILIEQAKKYDVDIKIISKDIISFLENALSKGFLSLVD